MQSYWLIKVQLKYVVCNSIYITDNTTDKI